MRQALYREHRPKSFDEVVGQEAITSTLKNAIKSGRVSHAYLFTGPRGVGKTSVARILAHEVNKLPYTDDSIHLDIIEIDAASNRRIDEIRELRDKVHITPTSAKYKVYIIDEVHMLTREAFNALLKTLEEPPEHCIFILATTEAHKVPETIVSRTQRFEFKPITKAGAVKHLQMIAESQKISIDEGALELLAEHGDGSFRDSISLLDQVSGGGKKLSESYIRQFLGLPPQQTVERLLSGIEQGNSIAVMELIEQAGAQGYDPAGLAKTLAKQLRSLAKNGALNKPQLSMLRQLARVPASLNPEEELEIILLEAALENSHGQAPPGNDQPKHEREPEPQVEDAKPAPPAVRTTKSATRAFDEAAWEEIVARTKQEAASLYTALRLASPTAQKGKLTLGFQFPLHRNKLNQTKNKDLVAKIVHEVTGKDMVIETVVMEQKPPPATSKNIDSISNIFPAAEVLES